MSATVLRAAALLAIAAAVVAACAPEPKLVSCMNDGECKAASSDFRFCFETHCVECVGRGSCGGHACVEGRCEQ